MARDKATTKYAVVNGAAANTDIPVATTAQGQPTQGSNVQLVRKTIKVLRVTAAGVVSDVTAEVIRVSRQSFRLSTTNTTGEKLVVIWTQAA